MAKSKVPSRFHLTRWIEGVKQLNRLVEVRIDYSRIENFMIRIRLVRECPLRTDNLYYPDLSSAAWRHRSAIIFLIQRIGSLRPKERKKVRLQLQKVAEMREADSPDRFELVFTRVVLSVTPPEKIGMSCVQKRNGKRRCLFLMDENWSQRDWQMFEVNVIAIAYWETIPKSDCLELNVLASFILCRFWQWKVIGKWV